MSPTHANHGDMTGFRYLESHEVVAIGDDSILNEPGWTWQDAWTCGWVGYLADPDGEITKSMSFRRPLKLVQADLFPDYP